MTHAKLPPLSLLFSVQSFALILNKESNLAQNKVYKLVKIYKIINLVILFILKLSAHQVVKLIQNHLIL